jgi:integrase
MKIGRFDEMKLEQARDKATEYNYLVGQGKDPARKAAPKLTYGALFARYMEDYAKLHTRTWLETEKNHRRHFAAWDKRSVTGIKREHVQTWVNTLAKSSGKYAANRAYNTFRAVFSWGLSQGLFAGENPCLGVKIFKTNARERFILPGNEFDRFAAALNAEPDETIRDFFWMCLFTGARCSNVLAMQWSQIEMDLQQWQIPVTKNDQSQTIPLTVNAMHILRSRERNVDRHAVWVFPSDRTGWKSGVKEHIKAPRKAFQRIIARAGIEDLRIHDLRRTAGSYMAMQNVSPTIIGKALGHRSPQSTAIYTRLTQDPVRNALEESQAAFGKPEKLLKRKAKVVKISTRNRRQ